MNEVVAVNVGWLIVIAVIIGLIIYILYLEGKLDIAKLNASFLSDFINELEKERSKQSDQLRQKGIDIDKLEKEKEKLEKQIKKYVKK